jgi:tetratricopeptide (TPR) repeat protein
VTVFIGEDRAAQFRRIGGLLLIVLAVALYAPGLRAPFVFDDQSAISSNPTLRSWWPIWTPLVPPGGASGVVGRPLVNLSLALNHAISGDAPWSYHLTNALLHGAAAWLLFSLVRRTLLRLRPDEPVAWLAWSVALVWTVHPLQTESVTCVVQRTEVLASLFYLATLLAFVRSLEPAAWSGWRAASVVACAAGMASKEIVATAPLAVLLYDRAFVAGSFAEAWRARRGYYGALAATWLLLGALVLSHGASRGGTSGFEAGVGVAAYLLTQAKALALYLKLTFWPRPLVLDYGTATIGWREAWAPGLLVLALLGGTLVLLVRRAKVGFVAALFFLLLAPSSSFVPLATQTIAEHRMYLPLACVLVLVAVTLRLSTRFAAWILCAFAVPLAVATVARNTLYRDPLALWQQTVEAVPENPRARIHLGNALLAGGRLAAATSEFRHALELQPGYTVAQLNLGSILLLQRRAREALPLFEATLAKQPNSAPARVSYASTLSALGRPADAAEQYRLALQLEPDLPEANYFVAITLLEQRRVADAVAHLERAARGRSGYAEPRRLLERLGRVPPP